MKRSRTIAALWAGLASFGAFEALLNLIARQAWPDYAAAAPERTYTVSMLLARLIAGFTGVVCASVIVRWIESDRGRAPLSFGLALLAISVIWHIRIWPQYPVWYHIAWFACLIPAAMLGARLHRA